MGDRRSISKADVHGPINPVPIKDFGKASWKDAGNPHNHNPQDGNDINKALPASIETALKKMFRLGTDAQIRTDGNGRFSIRENVHAALTGKATIIDVRNQSVEMQKDLEYHTERHIISEHTGIEVEDINQVKEINGEYHYKDKKGDKKVTTLTANQRDAINRDTATLGLNNDKKPMSASMEKALLEKAAEKVKDVNLKESIKNGMIHSDYDYDAVSGEYKFYMMPMKEDIKRDTSTNTDVVSVKDRPTETISIKKEDLPPSVEKGLEYRERKLAVMGEFNLREEQVQDLKMVGKEIHFKGIDGQAAQPITLNDTQMKNIETRLAAKGFNNNTQRITDSIDEAVIEHAAANDASFANVMVYDYTFDKRKSEHVYHVVKKEKTTNAGTGEVEIKDGDMEKVSFTQQEHEKLLDDAKLNVVENFGVLPDGKQIRKFTAEFYLNDKASFLVKDTEGGLHALTEDSKIDGGGTLGDAIISELNVKPRVDTDILSEKDTETLVGTKGTDSPKEILEKELEYYKNWTKHTLRLLKFLGGVNDMGLQAAMSVEQLTDKFLQAQDSSNQQQPIGSVLTGSARRWAKKSVEHKIKELKQKIKIESQKSGPGKGAMPGKATEKMEEFKEMIRTNRGPNGEKLNISEEDQRGFLDQIADSHPSNGLDTMSESDEEEG